MSDLQRRGVAAGQGAILLCAFLWSTSGLIIKLIDWHPMLIAGGRSALAALFLFTVRCLQSRRPLSDQRAIGDPRVLAFGGLAYAATMISFVIANKLTASANAILLQYSAPVWAALLGWIIIREKPRWEIWAALALVMAGLVIFFREGLAGGSLFGDGIALFSGACFGANSVAMRMQKDANPADSMLVAHVICAVCSIPFWFTDTPVFTAPALLAILYMGIIQIGVTCLLFAYGIKRVSAVQAMLTAMLEPILNPVWVFVITGEKPTLSAVVGGAVIVSAVLFSSVVASRRTASAAAGN